MTCYYDRDLNPISTYMPDDLKMQGRRVLRTEVGGYLVSTVWLSIDHSFGGPAPIVFETLIWEDGGHGLEVDGKRHASEEEAARWHLNAVDAIRAGATPGYNENDEQGV